MVEFGKEFKKDYANGKIYANFTQGHIVNINGFNIKIKRVIKNGELKIGTIFKARTFN